jgi:hypothetical protein
VSTFDNQFLVDDAGHFIVQMGVIAFCCCTTRTGYVLNDLCLILLDTFLKLVFITVHVIIYMQVMYNYVPEPNHVSTVHTVLQLFCIYSLCHM